jgi:hypothetical protein
MIEWHSFAAPAAGAGNVQTPREAYSAEDIHRQLNRMYASRTFRGSLRLKRFLRFVIETTLAGQNDRIKAYTIAVEALGRGSDFDPQSDPIVRVEAGRLRQALARYYAGPGCDDTVIIDLPRGAYVPVFYLAGGNKNVLPVSTPQEPGTTTPGSADAQAPEADVVIGEQANSVWFPGQPLEEQSPVPDNRKIGIVSAVGQMPVARICRMAF